jgi:hypothetical protein
MTTADLLGLASLSVALVALAVGTEGFGGPGLNWHFLCQFVDRDRRISGFMLVAPFPCSLMQADVICERASTRRDRLLTGDVATLERRVCRHCIGAVRRQ